MPIVASPNWQNPQGLVGTVNGINKSFTFPALGNTNYVITVGGIIRIPGVDYTVAGLAVTFVVAPIVQPIVYF